MKKDCIFYYYYYRGGCGLIRKDVILVKKETIASKFNYSPSAILSTLEYYDTSH